MPANDRPTPRVLLVTGASRGIGRAVADRLERDGALVHRAARSLEPGPRSHRVDLLDPTGPEALIESLLREDGRLDGVVHAPGDYLHGRLDEVQGDQLEALFRSNVSSAMHLIHAARAAVRAAQGSWVFFGCVGLGGLRARRESAAYASVKTALLVLARSMALEEAAHGVRVNMVSPGLVPHASADPTTRDPQRLGRVPLGATGTLSSIEDATSWLLSGHSSQVTGQNLEVSGGFAL